MWAAAAWASVAVGRAAEPIEPGFEVATYATDLNQPVALAFAPDGRLFVAEKGGRVCIVEDRRVREPPFTEIDVHSLLESGLLGLALDPDFTINHYVYLFATTSFEEQQILRFTEVDGIGTDRTVIRRFLPTHGTFHNAGCLRVGPDRKLYFSIGDNTIGDLSQRMTTLAGKISRINLDGSTPTDNPFTTPTGTPRAIYALGFRNPFRFCFAPDGRMFVMDVGSDFVKRREEINVIHAGDNGGWPVVEGTFDPTEHPEFVHPIYTYTEKGSAPVGVVYYTGGQFPSRYAGNLFHVDYILNRVYRVVLDGDRVVSHSTFVQGEGSPVDLTQGPDGGLYYCELFTGEVKRVRFIGDDNPDSAVKPDPADEGFPLLARCGAGSTFLLALAIVAPLAAGRRRRRPRAEDSGARKGPPG
ncbi:MAG: PQQ-dependent sugar dehydrogenase [Phycisphaerae bacterium]